MNTIEIAGSVLGDHEFTEQEQEWIYQISVFLRNRESAFCPGREDMGLYARTAASIYKLAKTLHGVSINSKFPMKSMDEWLRVITGKSFGIILPKAPQGPSDYENRVKEAYGGVPPDTLSARIEAGPVTIDVQAGVENESKE